MADARVSNVFVEDGWIGVEFVDPETGSTHLMAAPAEVGKDVAEAFVSGVEIHKERQAIRAANDWRERNGNEPPPKLGEE